MPATGTGSPWPRDPSGRRGATTPGTRSCSCRRPPGAASATSRAQAGTGSRSPAMTSGPSRVREQSRASTRATAASSTSGTASCPVSPATATTPRPSPPTTAGHRHRHRAVGDLRVETGRAVWTLDIPADSQPLLAHTRAALWVASQNDQRGHFRLSRIDPDGRRDCGRRRRLHPPRALVPVRGGLWVICGDGTAVLIDILISTAGVTEPTSGRAASSLRLVRDVADPLRDEDQGAPVVVGTAGASATTRRPIAAQAAACAAGGRALPAPPRGSARGRTGGRRSVCWVLGRPRR